VGAIARCEEIAERGRHANDQLVVGRVSVNMPTVG
jgi:hypothetical protein